MSSILGIKFRDCGQVYFFTTPDDDASSVSGPGFAPGSGPHSGAKAGGIPVSSPASFPDNSDNAEDGPDGGPDAADSLNEVSAESFEPPSLDGDEAEVMERLDPSLCPQAASGCSVHVGDIVIAETGQGLGLGKVVHVSGTLPSDLAAHEVKPILRVAGEKDQAAVAENRSLTTEAFRYCAARIRGRELEMKLVDVEVLFDKSKFIFYFTAPTRIDFRELVKDLVREYHVRIELRQIGVRHETQMIGAIGNCGMVCCCRRFLRKFAPVTIKMAKEQNLFLNPAKISGICGRLLCCLSYEQENYDAFHRECPRLGKRYQTKFGDMKILRANMFRNSVVALNTNNEEVEFTLEEWQAAEPRRPESQPGPSGPSGSSSGQPQCNRSAEKPARPQHDGFMVVSADPDSLDHVDDDVLAGDDCELDAGNGGGDGGSAPREGAGPARPDRDALSHSRRKRRRRPQS